MPDYVDERMTQVWPAISEALANGLTSSSPSLDECVPTAGTHADAVFRVDSVNWTLFKDQRGHGHKNVRQAVPEVVGAYEYRRSLTINLWHPDPAELSAFAHEATEGERGFVLDRLYEATRDHTFQVKDKDDLARLVGRMRGPCRLLGPPGYESLSKGAARFVPVRAGVLPGTALLVREDAFGPLLTRIGSGLTASWVRGQEPERVTILLASQFFLERTDQVAAVSARGLGASGHRDPAHRGA